MITVGFIGNGKSTNRYHLPFILKTEKYYVKTIFAPTFDSPWKSIKGVNYTTNLDNILQDKEISLIIITTPSDFHFEYAKLVLEYGKNVVLEKPFTNTLSEAEELFQLAEEKGVVLQGYQNRRFDSDFLTTQRVISSEKIGDLLEIEMHFDYYRPEILKSITEFSLASSYLYGHACHTLD